MGQNFLVYRFIRHLMSCSNATMLWAYYGTRHNSDLSSQAKAAIHSTHAGILRIRAGSSVPLEQLNMILICGICKKQDQKSQRCYVQREQEFGEKLDSRIVNELPS